MKYALIEKTPGYLIINKPAGLLVHETPGKKSEDSLAGQLLLDFPKIAKVGEDPSRPGIMHRLDRLVSGLMVIALTQESFDSLKSQFKKRTVNKYYTALVYGKIEADEGRIDLVIKRSTKGNKMAAGAKTFKGEPVIAGRPAITEFAVLKRYLNYTLLKVRLKTGRTHQIRCHFSAYGRPLVGDDLYGTKKTKAKNKKLALERVFLVATELEFENLKGEKKKYQIEIPEELKIFLKEKVK